MIMDDLEIAVSQFLNFVDFFMRSVKVLKNTIPYITRNLRSNID